MGEPNILLDSLLAEAEISHAGLAARINRITSTARRPTRYDHTAVARWIRDKAIPRGDVPEIICEIVGSRVGRTLMLSDIGMARNEAGQDVPDLSRAVDQTVALWRGDLNDRAFLAGASMLEGPAAIAPVFEWENPPHEMDVSRRGPGAVSTDDVQALKDARSRYEQMYRRVGGVPVRPRVVAFLSANVTPLLKSGHDDRTGRELFRAVGGLVALAGICAYDSNRQALSQRYLFRALRMAKASGNPAFGGYVIALLANQAMSQAKYRHVIQYAETALRGSRGHLSPALVTDLHTLQAKAYARVGDRSGCHAHMRRSETTAARIRRDDEPPETGYVQLGLLECQHAEALRRLGDLVAAQVYAEEALRSVDVCHLRGQTHRLATLALVLAERGELDQAVTTAESMLERAQGMESERITERIGMVADALRPFDACVVREFLTRAHRQTRVPL
ncbi:tetratricopeptide (TPR) repeat protein [Streptosporangium becharense]|uniref:Tetratricopeptide (TPR) repeat protein n=1 Tax=Streptosporangium becharense TaxID=1816182 RepID=A0A7W9IG55_9ACTN|nr:transcriptional regulator [Streptosporangium becharense]MBB2909525.1 tetratricopeptide (TPR) repeat protein [Streptosporangium becharense]MBB5819518.1 tetratricopeptide (TPR) repeat protein [Streptosporangium becharense]